MLVQDPYYSRAEVSNSDLGWLENIFSPPQVVYDLEQIYRFGNLVDAIITEPETVNYYKRSVKGEVFEKADFDKAVMMKKAFMKDPFCRKLHEMSTGQHIHSRVMTITNGITFDVAARCKYDLWSTLAGWGGDIKGLAVETQGQFEAACTHFNYDRQRAWYMDISGANTDVLIGISKKNFKIFKIVITRGDSFYLSGKAKYEELALKWHILFSNINQTQEVF